MCLMIHVHPHRFLHLHRTKKYYYLSFHIFSFRKGLYDEFLCKKLFDKNSAQSVALKMALGRIQIGGKVHGFLSNEKMKWSSNEKNIDCDVTEE